MNRKISNLKSQVSNESRLVLGVWFLKFPAKQGFTLIESLVAITIITLSIAGPLYIASRAIVAAEISRDQLTASSLAQEGIEYVRMMRDDAFLAAYPTTSTAWTSFLAGPISQCAPPNGCDPASQLDFTTVIPASFVRTIQATPVTDKDEKIVSKVSWSFHSTTYSVTITDHLTSWQ